MGIWENNSKIQLDENLIKNVQLKRGQGTDFSVLECRIYYNTIVIKKDGDWAQRSKSVEQKKKTREWLKHFVWSHMVLGQHLAKTKWIKK